MAYGFTRAELFAAVFDALDGMTIGATSVNVYRYRTSEVTPAQCPAVAILPTSAVSTEALPDEQTPTEAEFFTKTTTFDVVLFYVEATGGQTDTQVDDSLDAFEEAVLTILCDTAWHASLDGFETIESIAHTYALPGGGDRKSGNVQLSFSVRGGRQYG